MSTFGVWWVCRCDEGSRVEAIVGVLVTCARRRLVRWFTAPLEVEDDDSAPRVGPTTEVGAELQGGPVRLGLVEATLTAPLVPGVEELAG